MMRCNSSLIGLLLSFAVACPTAKSAAAHKPAAPPVPAIIEDDAKNSLAAQWMSTDGTPVVAWKTCLDALDLATRPGAIYSDALALLISGYDPKRATKNPVWAKNPYKVPDADADHFWDWVAGANNSDLSDKAKSGARTAAEALVDDYYKHDNQGLMDKVDANFAAKNPRRAIYELLSYAAKRTVAVQMESDKQSQLAAEKRDEARDAAALIMKINAVADSLGGIRSSVSAVATQEPPLLKNTVTAMIGPGNTPELNAALNKLAHDVEVVANSSSGELMLLVVQVGKLVANPSDANKTALKDAAKAYLDAAESAAQDAQTKAADSAKALSGSLQRLENIRLCYASVPSGKNDKSLDYRQQLVKYVGAKFHP
jgi:hypothetical protein